MRKNTKKILAFFLALILSISGMAWADVEGSKVQAATVAEDGSYVALDKNEVTWSGETGEAPVAANAYAGWLFAGWFTNATCTSKHAITDVANVGDDSFAKFVRPDTLNVKIQISGTANYNGNYVIRFVSSVDSLNYKNVGFVVNETMSNVSNTVYERIDSSTNGSEYEFSPKVVGMESKYFFTAKLQVAPADVDKDYSVNAFWETLDGTKVTGAGRSVAVNDNQSNVMNLPVEAKLDSASYTASFTTAGGKSVSGAAVEVLLAEEGNSNVRITLPAGAAVTDVADLDSATKISISDSSAVVATAIYRNYYTSHVPASGTAAVADTTWYTVNPTATEFVIASSADLYGLTSLVNNGNDKFLNDTIVLVRDVEVNKGTAVSAVLNADGDISEAAKWVPASGEATYEWVGPGYSSTRHFDGTFDGDNNTISGLYRNYTKATLTASYEAYVGLFGRIEKNASVCNVRLTNSYFYSNGIYLGMIGYGYALRLHNLYCDAIFVADSQLWQSGTTQYPGGYVGGIIGRQRSTTNNVSTAPKQIISNCWFDGEIYANEVTNFVGSMVGQYFQNGNFVLQNCLNTGYIYTSHATTPYIGGMFGQGASASNYTMSNCLDAGEIFAKNAVTQVGGLFGNISPTAANAIVENTYTISNLLLGGVETKQDFYQDKTGDLTKNATVRAKEAVTVQTERELQALFPLLEGEAETPWVCDTVFDEADRGTPMLKQWADLWKTAHREQIKVEEGGSGEDVEGPWSE